MATEVTVTAGGEVTVDVGFGGDVTGPGSSTDNAIARFDGTTGAILQNSGITIADGAAGTLSGTNTGDQNLFSTVAVSGQSNIVADSTTDTLTFVAGTGVSLTTDSGTDSLTVTSTVNSFATIAVSGQSDVVADSTSDTLTLAAGTGTEITTNATTDTVTIASTINSFSTIAVSGQSNVVADAAADTLTLVAGSGMTITTDAGADSVTFAFTGSGSGDVQGPAVATDAVPALYDGTSGKVIKNSTPTGTGNPVMQTSPTLTTPNIGTPSAGVLTNCTGLPISTGLASIASGMATFLTTPTSANLAATISGETGTGSLVFATSPTFTTPALGTPSSGNLSNCTGIFTTGMEMGYCISSSAPTGWVRKSGGTIGSATSGASERANADTVDLYTLLWNNYANAECPVSTGRGASAAADFAANKTLTLPDARGRASIPTKAGTFATLGANVGAETHTLTEAELPVVGDHSHGITAASTGGTNIDGGASYSEIILTPGSSTDLAGGFGSGSAHNNIQPSLVTGCVIIKL